MALQVWLPLTKDLRQQGLSNVTVVNNGATINTSGKLGSCYYFNRSASNYLKIDNPITTATNGVSMAFWVKIPSNASGNNQIVHIGNGSGWNNNRCTCFIYQSSSSLIFSCGDGGGTGTANSTQYGCKSSALTLNVWTHVACTYSTGKMKIYLNGVLDKEYTTTIVPSFTSTSYIGVGAAPNANEPATIYVNDIRIYNHTLSQMEVKQLSQGLILHYPLINNGLGNPNILTDFDTSFLSYDNGTFTLFSNQMNGGTQEIVSNIAGATKCLHLHNSGGNGRQYRTKSVTSGKTYTISADYYSTSAQNPAWRGELNGGNYSWLGANAAYTTPGQWQRLSYTYSNLTSDATIYFFIYCANGSDCYVKNIKIEESDTATPYCLGSITTFNIEYDCSGFCNNGTRTGTFTWTSNTPKYSVSQYFNGSNYILTDNGSFSWFTFDKCTIAAWMKPTITPSNYTGSIGISHDSGSGYKTFCISNYGGKFTVNSANGSYVNTQSTYTLPLNEWHYCVATLDGTTVNMYVDGVLNKTFTIDWGSTTVLSSTFAQVGVDMPGTNEIYTGYYSDVRIYATALSADDVKSLYQNCATIDPDGTIRGQIRS